MTPRILAITVVMFGVFAAPSVAAPDTFNGGTSSDWNDPANWSAGLPDSASDVAIAAGKTATLSAGVASATIRSLAIDAGETVSVAGGKALTVGAGGASLAGALSVDGGSTIELGATTNWTAGTMDLGTNGT